MQVEEDGDRKKIPLGDIDKLEGIIRALFFLLSLACKPNPAKERTDRIHDWQVRRLVNELAQDEQVFFPYFFDRLSVGIARLSKSTILDG